MLVGKIIYFTFSFLMILIEIFWFTQRLSQLKAVNYIMGFLGPNGFHTYCIYVV